MDSDEINEQCDTQIEAAKERHREATQQADAQLREELEHIESVRNRALDESTN